MIKQTEPITDNLPCAIPKFAATAIGINMRMAYNNLSLPPIIDRSFPNECIQFVGFLMSFTENKIPWAIKKYSLTYRDWNTTRTVPFGRYSVMNVPIVSNVWLFGLGMIFITEQGQILSRSRMADDRFSRSVIVSIEYALTELWRIYKWIEKQIPTLKNIYFFWLNLTRFICLHMFELKIFVLFFFLLSPRYIGYSRC